MPRCPWIVKLSLLLGAVILSVGWALSESRMPRHSTPPPAVPQEPPAEDVPRQARQAPPLPARPLPPPLPPPPPPRKSEPPAFPSVAKLSGRVVDHQGRPRGDVKADLDFGDLCIWIYTDGEGRFSAQLPPGEYTISALDGDDLASPTRPLSLRAGEEVRDVVLELTAPPPEPPEDEEDQPQLELE